MLQSDNLQAVSAAEPEFAPSATFGERIDLVFGFLRRRYLSILVCLLLALPVGALYVFGSRPTYTASAVMMIETRPTQLQASLWGNDQTTPAWIESQIGVIKSVNVLAYVAKQLRLADDSEFVSPKGGWIDNLTRLGRRASEPKSEAERVATAIGRVSGGLDVRRLGQSYMLQINYSSDNPDLAVKIANAMIDGYVFDQLNSKYQINRRAGDWLQERLQSLREQAATAERAVIDFKTKNNIVATRSGGLMNEQQLGEISGQLAKARAHAADVQTRLNRIEAVRQAYRQDRTPGSADETVTEEMGNPIINGLRSRYLELMNRAAEWSVKYGENHNAVVNVRNQIRAIRSSVRDELGRIEETYKSELEIAKKTQDGVEKALSSLISQSTETNQAQVTLFSLEAAAKSYRKLYDNFLQQYTESVQQQSFPISNARSLSSAAAIQTGPKAFRGWMFTILGGGMLGVGLGVFREMMDRRFRTKEHIQDLLDTKCLALVPLLTNSRTKRPLAGWLPVRTFSALSSLPLNLRERPEPAKTSARGATKSIGSVPTTLRGMADVTSSPFAEAIETMKLAIDLGDPAASSKIIGLTSSFAGEGKSTLAMGLAAQLARDGARVVLVDCDLRNPTLSRAIAPHAIVGILEVVKRKITPSEAIWNEPNTRIAFLPAVLPSVVDRHSPTPVNFLSSDAAKSFFQALQVQYDCVIVDLPPLACASDVRASTRFIDSYLLVVEWGRTKVDAVQYALRHAPEVSEKVIGTVLNKVDFAAMSSYDNYGARYYYGQSGAARSRH